MTNEILLQCRQELHTHLTTELLPFWTARTADRVNGGFITHFDQYGNDSGEDEKSLIAQTRSIYTYSSAHRAGYSGSASDQGTSEEGDLAQLARHGVEYLLTRMWDNEHGGFYWMTNRKGTVLNDRKIVYGQSFAIYCLSEYTLATGDPRGVEYAEKVFDLLQKHASDPTHGGYFEVFHRDWTLAGPGSAGGDRKTLDAHMHLMEAFTSLYECTGQPVHRRKLLDVIDLLVGKIMHPIYGTGVPQFWADWRVAPQIKFDVVWGWDRFTDDGIKREADDNTSYGHNAEFAWLLLHALDVLDIPHETYQTPLSNAFSHTVDYGVDWEFGGVFVEGSHGGVVYDREKEFWQQAEVLIGFLDAYRIFGDATYWHAYENVHRFVLDKMVNHAVGEWWPLMTRQGEPIWTHMGHSWKINYHTVRSMVQSIRRLDNLLNSQPMNPWNRVSCADYESYMNHESVGQLAFLNDITREKVEQRYPQTVAVYGACTGNGFAHFVDARTVYAVDVNPAFLAVCHDRYEPILNELVLVQADINHDPIQIPPDSLDLIICHMLLEYVDLDRTFASIRQTLRRGGLLNVVVERSNFSGWANPRRANYINTAASLRPIADMATEVSEETLFRHTAPDLRFEGRQTYRMPNGKSLVSYDFVKGKVGGQPQNKRALVPDKA